MGLLSVFRGAGRPARVEPSLAPVRRDAPSGSDPSLAWSSGARSTLGGLWGLVPSSTGEAITPVTALSISTVYGCVKRLGEDIGKLPIRIRRELPAGGYEVVRDHPLNRLFRKPNRWQTAFEFKAYLFSSLALRGNGYAGILRRGDGSPYSLIPFNPDQVSPTLSPDGTLFYWANHPALGGGLVFHQDDMIHLRGLTLDGGFIGVSPLYAAPDVFGLGIATQKHGSVLFRQGAQIPAFLKHPGKLSKEAQGNLLDSLAQRHGGVENAFKMAILEEGMSIEKLGMTSEEAQFLQTRKFSIPEICRMFGVPPHKVFDLSDAHYANITAANQQYVDDTLDPNCCKASEEFREKLLFDDERDGLEIVFDYNALLRGDRAARYNANSRALADGWKNRNEVRAEEGLAPIEGGDRYLVRLDSAGDIANPDDPSAPAKPGKGKKPGEVDADPDAEDGDPDPDDTTEPSGSVRDAGTDSST